MQSKTATGLDWLMTLMTLNTNKSWKKKQMFWEEKNAETLDEDLSIPIPNPNSNVILIKKQFCVAFSVLSIYLSCFSLLPLSFLLTFCIYRSGDGYELQVQL